MSQNYVVYLDTKNFVVQHSDGDQTYELDNYCYFRRKYKTLKGALKKAKEIQDEEHPEYGIYIL